MNITEITNEFFENTVQPEQILHLGTMCFDSERWPDVAKEAFYEDRDQILEAIGIEPPKDDEFYTLYQHLRHHDKRGWLAQFATPVLRFVSEDAIYSGWGYYKTQWFYADTYEQACENAIEWAKAYYEECRAEYLESREDDEDESE